MPIGLDHIVASTRARVARSMPDMRELERRAGLHQPRGFAAALRRAAKQGPAIISELKKASPSKGVIRQDFRVTDLAKGLEAGGASALSVLTDEEFFQGSLAYLAEASQAVSIPCLRKDFLVAEWQMVEARAWRADAVLLIVAALSQAELTHLYRRAQEMSLDVLCEVHDGEELVRAVDAGFEMIGVNSRNLRTFHVDLNVALDLAAKLPRKALRVAESGIHNGGDVRRLREVGYDAFLIGESLMKAEEPGRALHELLAEAARESTNGAAVASPPGKASGA